MRIAPTDAQFLGCSGPFAKELLSRQRWPPQKKSATISKGRYPVIEKQFEVIRRWWCTAFRLPIQTEMTASHWNSQVWAKLPWRCERSTQAKLEAAAEQAVTTTIGISGGVMVWRSSREPGGGSGVCFGKGNQTRNSEVIWAARDDIWRCKYIGFQSLAAWVKSKSANIQRTQKPP